MVICPLRGWGGEYLPIRGMERRVPAYLKGWGGGYLPIGRDREEGTCQGCSLPLSSGGVNTVHT